MDLISDKYQRQQNAIRRERSVQLNGAQIARLSNVLDARNGIIADEKVSALFHKLYDVKTAIESAQKRTTKVVEKDSREIINNYFEMALKTVEELKASIRGINWWN